MKKYLIATALLLAFQANARAQSPDTFLDGISMVGGHGSFWMSGSRFDGSGVAMIGGTAAVVLDRSLIIGGYGIGMSGSPMSSYALYDPGRWGFGHGGFVLGYTAMAGKLLHPAFELKLGWGKAKLETDHWDPILEDRVFVLTPSLGLELNLAKFMKLGVGAEFRQVTGLETAAFSNMDLSGPGVYFSLKFGGGF